MTHPLLLASVVMVVVIVGSLWIRHAVTRFVPRNRVRAMRMRLHLRMRPGRGFATLFELWLRWGRIAMWRRSKRIRPELTAWQRMRRPDEHSVLLGRAQRRHALRATKEEHVVLTSGPRTGKTLSLGAMLIRHNGCAVVTSSKIDLVQETSAIRARTGRVEVLNPARLGAIPSTVRFNPIDGAQDPACAIRRADAFASAVSLRGAENGDYFAAKCSSYLRALFLAAALVHGDMRLVARWALGSAEQAEHILESAGHAQWAAELSELRGPAEKSAATTKSVMSRALNFMNDPKLAEAVRPGDWDIEEFIRDRGTAYLVADSASEDNPLAPLFSCVVTEIAHAASVMGSNMKHGRLSPGLALYLDEVCQVCPLPLPNILSDAGGRGIQVVTVVHGLSALAARYGEHGAQTVLNTSAVKIWLPGSSEVKTLEMISKLAGQMSQRERDQDHHIRHDVITEAMARSLPPGFAIIISGGNAPVIAKLERFYKLPEYKQARRNGGTMAQLQPVVEPAEVPVQERPAVESHIQAADPWGEFLTPDVDEQSVEAPWGSA